MLIYLVRLTDRVTGKVAHKSGHSKYGQYRVIDERFRTDRAYDTFDIELLDSVQFSHPSWSIAKAAIITIEEMMRAVIPAKDPSFMIEEYFEREAGSMKLSGVTEFIFLKEGQTEAGLIHVFNKFKRQIKKTELKLGEEING